MLIQCELIDYVIKKGILREQKYALLPHSEGKNPPVSLTVVLDRSAIQAIICVIIQTLLRSPTRSLYNFISSLRVCS